MLSFILLALFATFGCIPLSNSFRGVIGEVFSVPLDLDVIEENIFGVDALSRVRVNRRLDPLPVADRCVDARRADHRHHNDDDPHDDGLCIEDARVDALGVCLLVVREHALTTSRCCLTGGTVLQTLPTCLVR